MGDEWLIARLESQALQGNLGRCTLALIDSELSEVTSATLVRVGSHVLLATAGHCLPSVPSARLRLIGKRKRPIEGERLAFLKHARAASERIDVGFVELNGDIAEDFLGMEALPVERVSDLGSGPTDGCCIVMGVPAAVMRSPREIGVVAAPICGICTALVPGEQWSGLLPFRDGIPEPDTSLDVFVGFPADGWREMRRDKPDAAPDPKGMSGGGIWSFLEDRVPWTPDAARLFAIQSRWDPKRTESRYLRGTQIIHWLRLVAEHFPDLRNELEGRFPRLQRARMPNRHA